MAALPKSAQQPDASRTYPTLEQFLETHDRDAAATAFAGIKQKIAEVSGARAPQAKRVAVAIERAEGLLQHLFDVKEKLDAQKRAGKGRK